MFLEDRGEKDERKDYGGGVGDDEGDCAASPCGEGGEEEEERGGNNFEAGAGAVGADAAEDCCEVLVKGEREDGQSAEGDEQDAVESVCAAEMKDGGCEPGRGKNHEGCDGGADEEESAVLCGEPRAEAALSFHAGGVAFGDVGESEEDDGDGPVDEFLRGLVEAEFRFAFFAEEPCDKEQSNEGHGAGKENQRHVREGRGGGGGCGLDGEKTREWVWRAGFVGWR